MARNIMRISESGPVILVEDQLLSHLKKIAEGSHGIFELFLCEEWVEHKLLHGSNLYVLGAEPTLFILSAEEDFNCLSVWRWIYAPENFVVPENVDLELFVRAQDSVKLVPGRKLMILDAKDIPIVDSSRLIRLQASNNPEVTTYSYRPDDETYFIVHRFSDLTIIE